MDTNIILIITVVIVLVVVWVSVLHYRFLKLLKNQHNETWVALGKPKNVFSDSLKAELSITRFQLSGKYRTLNNPELTSIGNNLRIAHVVLLTLVITGLISAIVISLF